MMRLLIVVSFLFLLPVAIQSATGLNLGQAAFAEAAEPKKRKVPPLKERTYKVLSQAQLLIDPDSVPVEEGEEKPDVQADPMAAVELLKKSLERRGLNAYEVAQIWNTLAFAYYTLDDVPNTMKAYEAVLAQPQMQVSLALELGATRSLFQLYYADENYRRSLEYIARWEKINATRDATVTYIKATAFYQLEEYRDALSAAIDVEEIAREQERTLKENWLYLQVILYNELEDFDNVIVVLERMIVLYPKKQYWMHLAGLYAEKEWQGKALSAYYAAYIQDMLEKETEIVMLSQRLLNAEVPFEAARILEKGFDDGIIEKNEKNIRLLAASYTMAQEFNKAILSWQEATEFAEDGEIHYRLAQALSNEDRHAEAVKAYRQALKLGDLNRPEDVSFWLGISLMQIEEWNGAKKAFAVAAKDKSKAKSANQYIKYINGEKRRLAALQEMINGG